MKRMTREWVRKAEADYVAATLLSRKVPPLHDAVCFHCQQSAEKYLKALLEQLGAAVPRTHNLDDLLNLLLPHHPLLRSLRRGLIFLTDFAVETRSPGDNASKRQAGGAVRWIERVRTACRKLLGIKLGP